MTDEAQARTAYMAENRTFAKGNGWTRRLLETANFVPAGITDAMLERYPVPEANRS